MLKQREVIPYLLNREAVSTSAVVQGDVSVALVSRRNHNFMVTADKGPCYLLKQGIGPDKSASVEHEANFYQLVDSEAPCDDLDLYLVGYLGYDPEEKVLLLELLENAHDLRTYHLRSGRFPPLLATQIGKALGALHRRKWATLENDCNLSGPPPWVLSIHQPDLGMFREASSAAIEFIKIIQQSADFPDLLDTVRDDWRSESLIHFDIRWDNFLVFARPGSKRTTRLKLIDWEFARAGDPCWDVGAVFGEYLAFWLSSIPVTGEAPTEDLPNLARNPLEWMQPAIHAYWRSYARGLAPNPAVQGEVLLRAVRYGGVRLLQTAFEQVQRAAQLSGNVLYMMQLSMNVIQRPREAAIHLLGLSPNMISPP